MGRRKALASAAPADRSATLDYVQAMLEQLRSLAQAENYDMLTYLIDMAYVEASDIMRGEQPSAIQKEKRDGAT